MRMYWITLQLINGLQYRGAVAARNARAAEEYVCGQVGSRNVNRISVEVC